MKKLIIYGAFIALVTMIYEGHAVKVASTTQTDADAQTRAAIDTVTSRLSVAASSNGGVISTDVIEQIRQGAASQTITENVSVTLADLAPLRDSIAEVDRRLSTLTANLEQTITMLQQLQSTLPSQSPFLQPGMVWTMQQALGYPGTEFYPTIYTTIHHPTYGLLPIGDMLSQTDQNVGRPITAGGATSTLANQIGHAGSMGAIGGAIDESTGIYRAALTTDAPDALISFIMSDKLYSSPTTYATLALPTLAFEEDPGFANKATMTQDSYVYFLSASESTTTYLYQFIDPLAFYLVGGDAHFGGSDSVTGLPTSFTLPVSMPNKVISDFKVMMRALRGLVDNVPVAFQSTNGTPTPLMNLLIMLDGAL